MPPRRADPGASYSTYLTKTWREIEPSILIILGDSNNSSLDPKMYTETYTKVYDYCTSNSSSRAQHQNVTHEGDGAVRLVGAELYAKLQDYLKTYLNQLNPKEGETFLQFYTRAWQRFLIGSTRLNDILDYINRYWVTKERADGRREIYDILSLCMLSWRDYKFHANLQKLMGEIMGQIEAQRLNKAETTADLSVAIKSFVLLGFDVNDLKKQNLSVYINDFEKTFLTETYNFYTKESTDFIKDHGVVNYLAKAEARIEEELKRLEELNDHTRRPLNEVLNEVLIINHADTIRAELTPLLDQGRYSDIKRIHTLLKRVPSTVTPLLEDFQNYIKNQGLKTIEELKVQMEESHKKAQAAAIAAAAAHGKAKRKEKGDAVDPKSYINTLLSVHKKYQHVVEEAFDSNEAFVKALDSACQSFINKNAIATPTVRSKSRTPNLLALYSDELLKKKDSEDLSIDELMTVFNFIEDKESFEIWYRRFLSKRLMGSNMSPEDEEKEEYIIQKLKQANSLEYTQQITSMFNDIRTSKDLGGVYKESVSNDENPKQYISDLEPRVLDTTAWSSVFKDSNESFILPTELSKSQEKFTSIYQERFSGRQLNWLWSRSKVEVKANLSKPGKPPFSFTLTLFQYAILSPYNEKDQFTGSKLVELTALSPEVFKANVLPLVKNKLLVQTPPGEDNILKPATTFKMVKEYTVKKPKINFSLGVKQIDARNEDKETNDEVERRHHEVLKACIVRVMKARKNYKHEQLTSEVMQIITRFKPTVADIKKAIEVLIDEQYLARTEDSSGYEYLS